MFKEKFTEEELNIARQNGFILTGKAGTGKTTLLNVIFSEYVSEAKKSAFGVTKESKVFYLRLKNGRCISIVDTPGLSDPDIVCNNKNDLDNIHLKDIEKKVSDEKIHIKGILFLVNFQLERFDKSEQEALISYNQLFPLRRFWKHLIVIFTHDYADPNGDPLEEIKQIRDESNGIIFSKIMDKVKNVSDIIDYKNLRIKYYNSYSPVRNEKQKLQNNKNKQDLEILLNELCQTEPLFCKIEVIHVKNEKIVENGNKFLVEYEKIGFFDFNNMPLKEKINVIKKEPIYENPPPCSCDYSGFQGGREPDPKKDDELKIIEDKNPDNSKYIKAAGIGGLIGAAIGVIGGVATAAGTVTVSAIAAPVVGVGVAGSLIGLGIAKFFS